MNWDQAYQALNTATMTDDYQLYDQLGLPHDTIGVIGVGAINAAKNNSARNNDGKPYFAMEKQGGLWDVVLVRNGAIVQTFADNAPGTASWAPAPILQEPLTTPTVPYVSSLPAPQSPGINPLLVLGALWFLMRRR